MNRIIIQIEDAALEELDVAAKEDRVSRAAFVRDAVVMALAERRRRRELQQIVDSYTAEPQEADLIPPKDAVRRVWPD